LSRKPKKKATLNFTHLWWRISLPYFSPLVLSLNLSPLSLPHNSPFLFLSLLPALSISLSLLTPLSPHLLLFPNLFLSTQLFLSLPHSHIHPQSLAPHEKTPRRDMFLRVYIYRSCHVCILSTYTCGNSGVWATIYICRGHWLVLVAAG
jgi:hypothetical protein